MKALLLLISVAPLALAAPANAQSMQNMPGMNMPAAKAPPKKKPATKPATPVKRKTAAKPAAKPTSAKRGAPVAKPKAAAHDMSGMGAMPGMDMSGTVGSKASPKPDPHAGHDMSSMPGMTMPDTAGGAMNHDMPGMNMPAGGGGQPMEHDMSSMPGMSMDGQMAGHGAGGTSLAPGNAPAPAAPSDHYADRIYQNGAMVDSRSMLHNEHGASTSSMILFNLAEYQVRNGRDGYRWDGEAWFGKDLDRLVVKTEGEGAFREGVDSAEVQALYSRAIAPFFDFQAGIRQEFAPLDRTYAVVGIQGLAPYLFEVDAAAFLSDKGDLTARIEAELDQRITQRLVLQPRVEASFSAQDVPELGIGAGLDTVEAGLRLRYHFAREFAPYIGIDQEWRIGQSADYARAEGEDSSVTNYVVGIRFWF